MEFEYMYQKTALGILNVENISQCCIEAFNDLGQAFYFISKTEYGQLKIMTFGPTFPDFQGVLPKKYNFTFELMEYNDKKLCKAIEMFLQNPKANITQAMEKDIDEAMQQFLPIQAFYKAGGF